MKNSRKHIFVAACVALHLFCCAQKAGFAGKRFLVKTNLINGTEIPFNAVDIEFGVNRKISFTAGFQAVQYSRGSAGVKRHTGNIQPRNGQGRYKEYSTLSNGTTQGWLAEAGVKMYFNSVIPAPYGWYTSISAGYGNLSFLDYEVNYSYKDNWGFDMDKLIYRPPLSDLSGTSSVLSLEFPAFGYQRIFKRFFVLDGKISALSQYCDLPDNLLNAFEPNHYVRGNIMGYGIGNLNIGLSLYLKAGFIF